MAASYPTSVKSFTTKVDAVDTYEAAHVNDLQLEMTAVETDLLEAWTSFDPTFNNFTLGNGTRYGAYKQTGKVVHFRAGFTFGSTTAITGSLTLDFPVTAQTGASFAIGYGEAIDFGTAQYGIFLRLLSSTAVVMFADNGTSLVSVTSTVPFTWVETDILNVVGTYEAA